MRIDVLGQWQLHQDAMNGRVLIQRSYACQQGGFAQIGRVGLQHRVQAVVLASFDFVAHVDLTGRAVADQNNRQSGDDAFGFEGGCPTCDVGAQLGRKGVAIN